MVVRSTNGIFCVAAFCLALLLPGNPSAAESNAALSPEALKGLLDAPSGPWLINPTLALKSGGAVTTGLPGLKRGGYYGITVSVLELEKLSETERITITIEDAQGKVAEKILHVGDPDLYITMKPRIAGDGKISSSLASSRSIELALKVEVAPMKIGNASRAIIAAQPANDWENAQPIELGRIVFAANDERPYIPAMNSPSSTLGDLFAGTQWYTFTWAGPNPALVHFDVDIQDRDVPVDVALFVKASDNPEAAKAAAEKPMEEKKAKGSKRKKGEKKEADKKAEGDKDAEPDELVPYAEGVERFVPEKSTPFHGLYKFVARTVAPGTYYVRVMGNHPAYTLRTRIFNSPPYDDPRDAIRTGMDYLIKKGDSWHANTPRRGGIILRTSNPFGETAQCIACHPTHFTTRGELIAIENGYPVRERSALQFLTDRLYNNPRPIYGKPEAAWVRMISAPGNVMSRLGYMLMNFEKLVSHEERPGLLNNLGNYLEMYWEKLDHIYTESNGNAPKISGFEIAMHSGLLFEELYRRTHQEKYRDLRRKMEKIVQEGEAFDNVDLCWKTIALATFDKNAHEAELKALADQIFSRQKPDGTWAMPFGTEVYEHDYRRARNFTSPAPLDDKGEPVASEFQTYHCIYALAKAGVTMDDARLAKSVRLCLSRQQPHGGWQGNKDYKNFDTPFRDTQYALMALSEIYKGPGSSGWMAGFTPAPKEFDLEDTAATLEALDQYWEDPGLGTRLLIRRALDHPQPLVRQAAAAAAGRLADADAAPLLAERLGDRSKLVQREAAWALRQIASRRGTGFDLIQTALKSPDSRTRWGAARIFKQHFRYLTDQWEIAQTLLEGLGSDPAVTVRMEAAQALWQWWFWTPDDARKGQIEDRFIACMDNAEHPWVRRNLIEGFHNMQDDNVSYLYNSWIHQLSDEADQKIVTDGHRAYVKAQAERISRALTNGTQRQRDGILQAFYAFHLRQNGGDIKLVEDVPDPQFASGDWLKGYRQFAAYDPLSMGNGDILGIGNDHEPPTYYEDSGPMIGLGMNAVLEGAPPAMTLGVLMSLKDAKGVVYDSELSNKLIDLALDSPEQYRDTIRRFVGDLLPENIDQSEAVAQDLKKVIEKESGAVLGVAEAVLVNPRNLTLADNPGIGAALKTRLMQADLNAPDLPALTNMLVRAEGLQGDSEVVDKSFKVLLEGPAAARQSTFRSMIIGNKFLLAAKPRERFQAELNVAGDELMLDLLSTVAKIDFAGLNNESSQNLALGVVTTALGRPSVDVKKKSLETVRTMVSVQSNPSVAAQLKTLSEDADEGVRESAATLLKSISLRGKKSNEQDVAAMLDFGYFVSHVNPILQNRELGDQSCADCHMNHSVLKLNPAIAGEALSTEDLRENYLSALKVLDLNNPEESLMLIKPRMPFEGIELPGNYRKTHGGNVRWKEGKENEAYKTILKWVQGAREETAVSQAQ